MKTKALTALLLSLFMSAPAWALYIDQDGDGVAETDVGSPDAVLDAYVKGSGPISFPGTGYGGVLCSSLDGSSVQAEECWAEGVLGGSTDLTFSGKAETVNYLKTYTDQLDPSTLNTADAIAFALTSGPGYYILKNSTEWVLLQNLAETGWGVIDLDGEAVRGLSFDCTSGCTISHVTEFNGTSVPEPGSLALLGIGLLSLGAIRRRRLRV